VSNKTFVVEVSRGAYEKGKTHSTFLVLLPITFQRLPDYTEVGLCLGAVAKIVGGTPGQTRRSTHRQMNLLSSTGLENPHHPRPAPVPASAEALGDKLRVLQVGKFYPPHIGGMETHLEALCGGLRNHTDLRVIVSSDDRNSVEEVLNSVPVSRLATVLKVRSTAISLAMAARIRNSAADLVHIHLPNPTAVLAYLASGYRGPLVVTYHSDIVRQKVLARMFEPLLNAALRRSSAIITTSTNYLATSPVLQTFRDRCHVIPFGMDTARFEQCDPDAVRQVRARFGERLVISVGRLVYYKGLEHLIRAMTQVSGQLVILGDGPLRGKLERLAAELGVADKVFFAGAMDDAAVLSYYHAAALFVLASVARSEAFGIVQIEAMAAGLPVVNTSLDSGVPLVSLHEQTGLTVPPADPKALAAAINRLLDDPALRHRFGHAGKLRARQEFDLDVMVHRTLQLYQSAITKR
jgi:glycosyltransferase involved in cell wall biosynthesis